MNSPIKLPSIPYELLESLSDGEVPLVRAYAEQAARKARSSAIEDVACMICRRFDLKIPADLGPKLVHAIRSMDQESNHE